MSDTAANPGPGYPRFLPAGDGGLVVELGNAIDERINAQVIALDRRIARAEIEGVLETVPTYRSLLVLYDPLKIRARVLTERLAELVSQGEVAEETPRRWIFPVAYGGEHGMDLDFVARSHDLTTAEVIQIHSGAEYRVYMIGFAPGFTYLGGLPPVLATPRRPDPRPRTPAESVSLGGIQAAITSIEAPSGWHMLGRTPARLFDLRRESPFLLKVGDCVHFTEISPSAFERLSALAEKGELVAELRSDAAS
ncbi:MAG: 5-oxoprolinase subunit PxpB [Rhodospirillales bacterium]|nr:5-oxoprolinase subunit PxpB [Rhodospirillales bacterium]